MTEKQSPARAKASEPPHDSEEKRDGSAKRRPPAFSRLRLLIFVVFAMAASAVVLYFFFGFNIHFDDALLAALVALTGFVALLLGQLARYRFQVSLRTWMLTIAALCGLFALWTWQVGDNRAESLVARWIKRQGGNVDYRGFSIDPSSGYIRKDGWHIPDWLGDALGESYFGEIDTIDLRYTRIDDEDVARLADVRHLLQLCVAHSRITADGVAQLPIIPRVEYMTLDWSQVSEESTARLAEFEQLKQLTIIERPELDVQAGGRIAHLQAVEQVRSLDFIAIGISPADSAALASLPRLEEIHVMGDSAWRNGKNLPANGALRELAKSRSLVRITLMTNQDVTLQEVEAVLRIPTLRYLNIRRWNSRPLSISEMELEQLREKHADIVIAVWPTAPATVPKQPQPGAGSGDDSSTQDDGGAR